MGAGEWAKMITDHLYGHGDLRITRGSRTILFEDYSEIDVSCAPVYEEKITINGRIVRPLKGWRATVRAKVYNVTSEGYEQFRDLVAAAGDSTDGLMPTFTVRPAYYEGAGVSLTNMLLSSPVAPKRLVRVKAGQYMDLLFESEYLSVSPLSFGTGSSVDPHVNDDDENTLTDSDGNNITTPGDDSGQWITSSSAS